MGKPPGDEDQPNEGTRASAVDPDRAAILARRQRFIALALSGLATTGCDKPNDDPTTPRGGNAGQEGKGDGARPQPCLDVAPVPSDDGGAEGSEGSTGRPQPCLEVAPPPEPEPDPKPDPKPQACLKVAPPDPEPDTTQPCLNVHRVEPEPDPKPQPCLKVAPPKKDDDAKPRPCLRVAKPKDG